MTTFPCEYLWYSGAIAILGELLWPKPVAKTSRGLRQRGPALPSGPPAPAFACVKENPAEAAYLVTK